MTRGELQQNLAKQVDQGELLHCPICSSDWRIQQPLCAYDGGNRGGELFCPHCDLYVTITVNAIDLEG